MSPERAQYYQDKAYEWLKSFDNEELDFNKSSTWIKENLPVQSTINTFKGYACPHEKFMWEARMEPGVLDVFSELWGTDKLLVSFDSLNVTFPNRTDKPRKGNWEHVDQSPLRRGLHCVQGIINISPSGPEDGGLTVIPESHKHTEEFFDTATDKTKWTNMDLYLLNAEELAWFANKGLKPYKVCAKPGDLIIWDSRLIHYGAEPTEKSNQIRTVIYSSYTPAAWASADQLQVKKEVFENWGGTTHWPHDNIVRRPTETCLEDGTRDPRDRVEPREKPELSEKLLKLAGVVPY
jgi:ectoine hydroxylase-related dioxygenase (phytanoyl-CoA dioxygenase family)